MSKLCSSVFLFANLSMLLVPCTALAGKPKSVTNGVQQAPDRPLGDTKTCTKESFPQKSGLKKWMVATIATDYRELSHNDICQKMWNEPLTKRKWNVVKLQVLDDSFQKRLSGKTYPDEEIQVEVFDKYLRSIQSNVSYYSEWCRPDFKLFDFKINVSIPTDTENRDVLSSFLIWYHEGEDNGDGSLGGLYECIADIISSPLKNVDRLLPQQSGRETAFPTGSDAKNSTVSIFSGSDGMTYLATDNKEDSPRFQVSTLKDSQSSYLVEPDWDSHQWIQDSSSPSSQNRSRRRRHETVQITAEVYQPPVQTSRSDRRDYIVVPDQDSIENQLKKSSVSDMLTPPSEPSDGEGSVFGYILSWIMSSWAKPRSPQLTDVVHDLAKLRLSDDAVANYRDLYRIGSGGFGVVRKVQNKDCTLAVKSVDDKFFLKEAVVLQKLKHKNIVALKGIILPKKKDGGYQMVMDCYPADLCNFVNSYAEKGLEEHIARMIMADIVLAIDYLHDYYIAHTDLKPSNILVNYTRAEAPDPQEAGSGITIKIKINKVVVSDVGTAVASRLTPKNFRQHSDEYYAALDTLILDAKSMDWEKNDIYSLGTIAFFCGTGTRPFHWYGKKVVWDREKDLRNGTEECRARADITSERLITKHLKKFSDEGKDFIKSCSAPNPKDRLSAARLIELPWFGVTSGK